MNQRILYIFGFLGLLLMTIFGSRFLRDDLQTNDSGHGPRLQFRPNHEFTILHLSDLHYGDDPLRDAHNDMIQTTLINHVKPDLVVITGDVISGYMWDKKERGFFRRHWERFSQVYRSLGVPYAFTMGNHDHETDASFHEIKLLEKSNPFSVFDGSVDIEPWTLSNYLLKIHSSFSGAEDQVSALVWMLDSKDSCHGLRNGNGCINQVQLNWYERMSKKYAEKYGGGQNIDGMAFFHVPIPEFMHLWNRGKTFGFKGEAVSCPAFDTGVFESFRRTGNIRVVGCGHDHNNNYGGNWEGIDLIFAQKTGYGSYGPDYSLPGGRVFKLKEKMEPTGRPSWTYEMYSVFEDGSEEVPEAPKWQGDRYPQRFCHSIV